MGTRCLTVFKEQDGTEIAILYRQYDGYPDGHGKELADFLKGKKMVNGFRVESRENLCNGMGCLAAQVIAHFKDEPGEFYLMPAGKRNVWEDYTYIVTGKEGEEPRIEVENFSGFASEYDSWLAKFLED